MFTVSIGNNPGNKLKLGRLKHVVILLVYFQQNQNGVLPTEKSCSVQCLASREGRRGGLRNSYHAKKMPDHQQYVGRRVLLMQKLILAPEHHSTIFLSLFDKLEQFLGTIFRILKKNYRLDFKLLRT